MIRGRPEDASGGWAASELTDDLDASDAALERLDDMLLNDPAL
jgi:hypothetical protein